MGINAQAMNMLFRKSNAMLRLPSSINMRDPSCDGDPKCSDYASHDGEAKHYTCGDGKQLCQRQTKLKLCYNIHVLSPFCPQWGRKWTPLLAGNGVLQGYLRREVAASRAIALVTTSTGGMAMSCASLLIGGTAIASASLLGLGIETRLTTNGSGAGAWIQSILLPPCLPCSDGGQYFWCYTMHHASITS